MKSAWTDRLDLGAEPVQRVAMNAGEERPVAPFELGLARREASAKHHAVRFEQQERRICCRGRNAERIQPAPAAVTGPVSVESASQDLDDGIAARPGFGEPRRRAVAATAGRRGADGSRAIREGARPPR